MVLNFQIWIIYLPLCVISKLFDKNVLCSKFGIYAKINNTDEYEEFTLKESQITEGFI